MKIIELLSDYLFLGSKGLEISTKVILFNLMIACLISGFIFLVYRGITRKTFYSLNFNISLVAIAVITCAIMLAIQSNIVLSLGMVGALSIVRFRTAIKDPLDLIFLYWALSVGIVCGAGLAAIAVILSVIVAAAILLLQKYPRKKLSMILIVNSSKLDCDQIIRDIVKKHAKWYRLKSKNVTPVSLDMILELEIEEESPLILELIALEGITAASIMSHDGEITA